MDPLETLAALVAAMNRHHFVEDCEAFVRTTHPDVGCALLEARALLRQRLSPQAFAEIYPPQNGD